MHQRPIGVVGIGNARDQIGSVIGESAFDTDRLGTSNSVVVVTARQLLCLILRLMECQYRLAVSVLEIISKREALSPVGAVAIGYFHDPCAVGLVAAVHQEDAARQRWAGVR